MKRFWLGVAVLALLLALGIYETVRTMHLTQPIAADLSLAAQAAQQSDWELAEELMKKAKDQWQQHWDFLAATNHHGPMEEIDSQFARALTLLKSREQAEYAATCARISEMIQALGEAHKVNLRNLL